MRGYAVQLMVRVLSDEGFLVGVGENEEGGCGEVLWGAAWICGEYCRYVKLLNTTGYNYSVCVNLPRKKYHTTYPTLERCTRKIVKCITIIS